jgi:hypothetical protein
MKSLFEDRYRLEILDRTQQLCPDAQRRWGKMTAPQMIAHLTDQMGHTLGDKPCAPKPSRLRLPVIRLLVIYWLPWPKGRIKGPPDAFVTQPTEWEADRGALVELVRRFAECDSNDWPPHAMFGRMSRRDWGVFCYRHFDHHLRQFGA